MFARTLFTTFTTLSNIHTHTTNTCILISFFKDEGHAGSAPTIVSRTSDSRGNSGIFARPGHRSKRRIPLPATEVMPPCNDLQNIGEIVYTILYIYTCMREWSYEKFDDIYMIGSITNSIYIYP